ncbi:7912_t:CDS:10 [Entrophospora sp. SA101]|nr:7912_t:CDS:10 [Entrophospora sp. SA101]
MTFYLAVMKQINNSWEFMIDEDFNPVPLSLQLLDASSLGRDYDAFQRIKSNLDNALQAIVNEYYQGFNSSIGTFGGVINNISDSQERVKEMKSNLKASKEILLSKRSDLLQLWFRSQQYKEMIRILDLIEDFKETPSRLEVLLREKHFLTASRMLLDSIRVMEKKEMAGVGALSDLRRYLKAQQTSLHELLIEELHNHLYLKSSYCDSRWVQYTIDQITLPSPPMEWDMTTKETRKANYMTNVRNKKNLQVNTSTPSNVPFSPKSPKAVFTTMNLNDEDDMIKENLDINPETDSFYYMEILLESLAVLGKLPQVLEKITQRIPVELYQLVDKTVAEVEARYVDIIKTHNTKRFDITDLYTLESSENDVQMEILKDLLWTLYSKFYAVLQGHRFALEVVERISKRPSNNKTTEESQIIKVYPFIEIWKPVQNEVRSLLREYITDDEKESVSMTTPEASMQDLIKDKKARDATKQIFRFSDVDAKSFLELDKEYENNVTKSLKQSLPEIFSKKDVDERQLSVFVVDRFANNNSNMMSAGHRLVVRPDAFNISVLFKPTLEFLEKVKTIIPNSTSESSSTDFTAFLDDFVFNVFLPQIGDKIFELFHKVTTDTEAFQEDPNYKTYSPLPVVKVSVYNKNLCGLLQTMKKNNEEFNSMIITLCTQYYVKCFEYFQAIVSKSSPSPNDAGNEMSERRASSMANQQGLSATWVQHEHVSEILYQYPYAFDDSVRTNQKRKALCDKETEIELRLKKNRQIRLSELIMDSKKLKALANMYHSLRWLVAKIWELRGQVSKANLDDRSLAKINRRWSSLNDAIGVNGGEKDDDKAVLPLTGEMEKVELRCHALHFLDLATREGNYQLDYEAYEPDPYVIELNSDIVKFDESIASCLSAREHKFIFEGLDSLMQNVLINNATFLRNLNSNGVSKMTRNILALQQNLKNIVEVPKEISLDKSRIYYELYNIGPTKMLEQIKKNEPIFTFEEYKLLLEVFYKIDPNEVISSTSNRGDGPSSNRRLYNENLLELNELMLDYI